MENENPRRRNFIRKLASLTALAGIGGFLASRVTERSIIPSVQAADDESLLIGRGNEGSNRTSLVGDIPYEYVMVVENTSTSGDGDHRAVGLAGRSLNAPFGRGVEGIANATSGKPEGVFGFSSAPDGVGVLGRADKMGVSGIADSPYGSGVVGRAWAKTGYACGVAGYSDATAEPGGCGVVGCGITGVLGLSDPKLPNGIGVRGASLAPGAVPIVAEGRTDQTANLQEWGVGIPSEFTRLAFIDKDGNLGIGNLRITKAGNNFAFLNAEGTKIAVLDSEGNLLLKGKVKKLE